MKNLLYEIYQYKEKVLQLQYEASECITHKLTRGEVREDFIKKMIKESITDINTLKGIVTSKEFQSPQTDLIIPKKGAILTNIGEHSAVDVHDVKFVFEIKSKLRVEHIKKINSTLKELKSENKNIRGGIICYKIDCLEESVLKKFGYHYDKEIKYYQRDMKKLKYEFDYIDYIISFDEDKEFIISKNILGDFVLDKEKPIINKFLTIFNNSEVSNIDE